MPLEADEVFAIVKEGSAGRPHVAQVMVARGYVKTVREAFDKYLGSGKPAHVQRKKLTPEDAVRLIRKAGGVPVFAHPGLADRDALIPGLIAAGLMGIECYYAEHSAGQRAAYLQICKDQTWSPRAARISTAPRSARPASAPQRSHGGVGSPQGQGRRSPDAARPLTG